MTHSSISAAVLIGGRSRRMGASKALLRLADEAETLVERTVATLSAVALDVTLVGTPPWRLPASLARYRRVIDRGTSAADGVIAALDSATGRFCIVVACDMPFLDAGLLGELGATAIREGRGVMAADGHGAHPLHAVWDRERLPELRVAAGQGERSLAALARISLMATVDLDAPHRHVRERWSVFNVNTPEDLEAARAHAGGDG